MLAMYLYLTRSYDANKNHPLISELPKIYGAYAAYGATISTTTSKTDS